MKMQTFREFVEELNKTQIDRVLDKFIPFCCDYLGLKDHPPIKTITGKEAQAMKSFGCWDGHEIRLNVDGRHPIDVCRTLAHELVHHAKNHTDGKDGSDDENEANALAGTILRKFGRANPDLF